MPNRLDYAEKFLDRDLYEIDVLEYMSLIMDQGYVSVGYFEISDGRETVNVQTIWTGLSSKLFVTEVEGGKMSGHVCTYSSEIDALVGHEQIVDSVKELI